MLDYKKILQNKPMPIAKTCYTTPNNADMAIHK